MNDIYSVGSSALPPSAHVVGIKGTEAISQPYRFEVGFTLSNGLDVDMVGAMGTRAKLVIDRGFGQPPFAFHGVLASVELLHELTQKSLYRATLVPLLWQLSLSYHSRIFTDGSIPEIIEATLKYGGMTSIDYSFRLSGAYKQREHICQYRESNLDFIQRLMEREGIYYYFEQGDDREVLVVTDSVAFQGELVAKPVKFFPLVGNDVTSAEVMTAFTCKVSSLPKKVEVKDYDYEKPSLDVSGSAPIVPASGGEIVSYGDNFLTPDEGKRLAMIRAEELIARRMVFSGRGQAFYLRPGYTFSLDEHPRPSFNADYLTVALEHQGNQSAASAELKEMLGLEGDEVYRSKVVAIPAGVQFRAERATFTPRVYGVVDGVVDGEAGGPYAEIDAHGRYKVRVFFDESDLLDGKSSTWIRMLQPHGGSTEGFHFPLRKGTEVHIVFLGGDPDRPVIVGVGPNTQKPSPVTSKNHTLNVIQTGGANRLEMDDMMGLQYVTLSSPVLASFLHLGSGAYNFVGQTDGHALIKVGGNMDVQVTGDLTEDVTGTVTETYLSTQDTTVTGAVTQTYESTLDVTVTGAVNETLESTQTTTTTGAVTETYEDTQTTTVTGAVQETYLSTLQTDITSSQLTTVGAGRTDDITGDWNIKVSGNWNEEIGGTRNTNIEADHIITKKGFFMTTTIGATVSNNVGFVNTNNLGAVVSNTLGFSATSFLGAKKDLTVGLSQSLFVGVKIDTTVGVTVSTMLGGQVTATLAFRVKAVAGPEIDLLAGPKVQQAPINIYVCAITIIA